MARTETVRIEFLAELRGLRKDLAAMPGYTEDKAKAMVDSLRKQYKRAEKESKKLSKKLKDDSGKMGDALEGAKNAAEGFGGALGENAGRVEKFAQAGARLSVALGPMGAGALGVAAGMTAAAGSVGLLAAASVMMIRSAGEAADELAEMGATDPIPAGTLGAVEDFNVLLDTSRAQALRLQVLLAGPLADALGNTARVMTKAAMATNDLAETMVESGTAIGHISTFLFPQLAGGAAGAMAAMELLDKATASYDDELDAATASMADFNDRQQKGASTSRAAAKADREAAQALKERIAAMKSHAAQQAAIMQITADAQRQELSGMAAIDAAYDARVDDIMSVGAAWEHASLKREALAAAEEEHAEASRQHWASLEEQSAAVVAQGSVATNQMADMENTAVQMSAAFVTAYGDVLGQIGSSVAAAATTFRELEMDAAEDAAEARIAAAVKVAEKDGEISRKEQVHLAKVKAAENKELLLAFRSVQKAQRGEAVMGAAVAMMNLVSAMAYLGPGAPAAAALIVGPTLASQLAVIDAQDPPSFPRGGVVEPDHVRIAAQPGEGVVSLRGMGTLGRDGLDQLNRGGGGMGATTINVQIGRSVLASAVADALATTVDAAPRVILGRTPIYGG